MPKTYNIEHVVAYENGREATIEEVLRKADKQKYLEVLIPFSDPIAESPELQDASVRAMQHPHTTDDIFDLLYELKDKHEAKILLSIYLNTAFAYGYENFCRRAKESGVFGLNVKDMPFVEKQEIESHANLYDLVVVHTLATSDSETIGDILKDSSDVVYLSQSLKKKLPENTLESILSDIENTYQLDVVVANQTIKKLPYGSFFCFVFYERRIISSTRYDVSAICRLSISERSLSSTDPC